MECRRDTAFKAVAVLRCALLLPMSMAWAQSMSAARGVQQRPYIAPATQPFNSMARSTTPFNCDQYRNHPHPGMQRYCQGVENMTLRNEARRQGRPAPSDSIIELPALGSEAARVLGRAFFGSNGRITSKNKHEIIFINHRATLKAATKPKIANLIERLNLIKIQSMQNVNLHQITRAG